MRGCVCVSMYVCNFNISRDTSQTFMYIHFHIRIENTTFNDMCKWSFRLPLSSQASPCYKLPNVFELNIYYHSMLHFTIKKKRNNNNTPDQFS